MPEDVPWDSAGEFEEYSEVGDKAPADGQDDTMVHLEFVYYFRIRRQRHVVEVLLTARDKNDEEKSENSVH